MEVCPTVCPYDQSAFLCTSQELEEGREDSPLTWLKVAIFILKASYITVLGIAAMWRMKNKLVPGTNHITGFTLSMTKIALISNYNVFAWKIWCDLTSTEFPSNCTSHLGLFSESPLFIVHIITEIPNEVVVQLHLELLGFHHILDVIINRLLLNHLALMSCLKQAGEWCYDLCEWIFDTLEQQCDKITKLGMFIIKKLFRKQQNITNILELSQEQRHFYNCIMFLACAGYHIKISNVPGSIMLIIWNNYAYNINQKLWQTCLNLSEWILQLWERIAETLCEGFMKMPSGLQPNQYHTRYFLGLNRFHLFEYGILIQVLADQSHVGMRCFHICGIHVFTGVAVPVTGALWG